MTWEYDVKNMLEDDFDVYLHDREYKKLNDFISSLLKKQRGICADHYHCNTWIKDLSTETYNKILNAPEPKD